MQYPWLLCVVLEGRRSTTSDTPTGSRSLCHFVDGSCRSQGLRATQLLSDDRGYRGHWTVYFRSFPCWLGCVLFGKNFGRLSPPSIHHSTSMEGCSLGNCRFSGSAPRLIRDFRIRSVPTYPSNLGAGS